MKRKNIIVVTGGNGSIGRAIVKKFLSLDDIVIILDRSDTSKIKHENCICIKTDVTNKNDILKAKSEIKKRYGFVSHLISVAGGAIEEEFGPLDSISLNAIDSSIKLNLNSHIYLTKAFLPLLKNAFDNKSIVLISSINATSAFGLPAYSASKSGIYGFMHSVSRELGKFDIRINCVSPGTVPTIMTVFEPKSFEYYKNLLALPHFTKPDNIAEAVYSLTYIMRAVTNQNIVVDSGQTC